MKKVMFAFAAMLGSVAFVNAQDASSSAVAPATEQAPQQEEKTKIKSEELPAPVKKALEMQDYRGWLIDAAYKVEATEQYEVIGNHDDTKQGSAQGPTTAA